MQRVIHFECSNCGERIEVNGEMRNGLLTEGCVVCGATVTEREFG